MDNNQGEIQWVGASNELCMIIYDLYIYMMYSSGTPISILMNCISTPIAVQLFRIAC